MLSRKTLLAGALLLCCFLASAPASEAEKGGNGTAVGTTVGAAGARRRHAAQDGRQNKTLVFRSKVKTKKMKKTTGGGPRHRKEPRDDSACTRSRGICQASRYLCQGRYLRDKCAVARTRQCCVPAGPWSILCAGHHNNRVRACDVYGCGAYNQRRGEDLHEAVDLVCGDFAVVNAPFSGVLAGPVGRVGHDGLQYDGVKIISDGEMYCVKIFNVRPYRYLGAVSKGEGLGYVLPLQDRFSGVTSHLEVQMCDGSDPSRFL
ncbi:leukocyte cell-derived chemotaxin-2-like isoform X1 [Gadus chalcogrammus]|uniref:leukocyte cell-derived chemotaxin-2-like isoform X1 n=1 Tax=Gadus chalcogrammus TaxID=1042646 RepID=UPI0024C47523|nr:leukocyte cell-derived chemotaxin-2-like isoform X1 [Gadus chalcogrammus]